MKFGIIALEPISTASLSCYPAQLRFAIFITCLQESVYVSPVREYSAACHHLDDNALHDFGIGKGFTTTGTGHIDGKESHIATCPAVLPPRFYFFNRFILPIE